MQAITQSVVIAQIKLKWKKEQSRRRKVRTVVRKASQESAPRSEVETLAAKLRELGEDRAQMDEDWLEVPPPQTTPWVITCNMLREREPSNISSAQPEELDSRRQHLPLKQGKPLLCGGSSSGTHHMFLIDLLARLQLLLLHNNDLWHQAQPVVVRPQILENHRRSDMRGAAQGIDQT